MLEFIIPLFNALTYDFGEFAWIIAISVFLSTAVLFLIEFFISISIKKNRESVYFLCFSLMGVIISAYFAVQDFIRAKKLFISVNYVYAFLTAYVVCVLVFYSAIKKASTKRQTQKAENKEVIEDVTLSSNAIKYFKKQDISSEYLDVSYVKELIRELKRKGVSENDYKELEEMEVYLLRFVTRQPQGEERRVLSEYLSMLMKKLALYA